MLLSQASSYTSAFTDTLEPLNWWLLSAFARVSLWVVGHSDRPKVSLYTLEFVIQLQRETQGVCVIKGKTLMLIGPDAAVLWLTLN